MLTRQKAKGRKTSGTFAALPHAVMDSDDFRSLSGGGLKVLLGLLRQYRGNNNGDLSATEKQAKEWGVGSSATLAKALQVLQERNLVVKTREGIFLNPGGRCALYALTWHPIDECGGKLEIAATAAPVRSFSLERIKKPSSETESTCFKK